MLTGRDAVADALNLVRKRAHGAVVVVDGEGRPVGVVTEAACHGRGPVRAARRGRRARRLTVPLGTEPREVFERLHEPRRELALGVDEHGPARRHAHAVAALRA